LEEQKFFFLLIFGGVKNRGSSNLPILVEQRLGGVFWRIYGLEELWYGLEVNIWRSSDIWYLSEELRFGGAVVLY